MTSFDPGKYIDLARVDVDLTAKYSSEFLGQNERARGLWRRLYQNNEPGVLLADEVGKGKTFVALSIAFACLAQQSNGRVLVITHSTHMAKQWQKRWGALRQCTHEKWSRLWNDEVMKGSLAISANDLHRTAPNGTAAGIVFASYETLKKYGPSLASAKCLLDVLRSTQSILHIRLSSLERNRLTKEIFDCDLRRARPQTIGAARLVLDDRSTKRILKWLDPDTRRWKQGASTAISDEINRLQAAHLSKEIAPYDLLVIDEAHKLEGAGRHNVVARLLHKRFKKCILVTATPFALSVDEFRSRLLDFSHARTAPHNFKESINSLEFDDFQHAVVERMDFPGKDALQAQLQRLMVRSAWDHERERSVRHWRIAAEPHAVLPTLLLERIIDGVLQSGGQTHIASRRESLCSSWPAARASLMQSPMRASDPRWSRAFDAVLRATGDSNDPKITVAVKEIVQLLCEGEKVVVFTQRLETSRALAQALNRHPEVKRIAASRRRKAAQLLRHHEGKIAQWLDLERAHARGVIKVMAHSARSPKMDRSSVEHWWKLHGHQLGKNNRHAWGELQQVIGPNRRLPIVVRHDSETDKMDRNIEKFNLPSAPQIFIATPKAQEGIDLHHYCRHVVLFDLTWNPAAIEQRIGRVHRIGGDRGKNDKVVVVYCFQKGTYEEEMAARVQKRCEMMRVLLGAGLWLDKDREVTELAPYMMSFPA